MASIVEPSSTNLPQIRAEWIERAYTYNETRGKDVLERMSLSLQERLPVCEREVKQGVGNSVELPIRRGRKPTT